MGRLCGGVAEERVKGIEPSSLAWKAIALPLSYTRVGLAAGAIPAAVDALLPGPSAVSTALPSCSDSDLSPRPAGRSVVMGSDARWRRDDSAHGLGSRTRPVGTTVAGVAWNPLVDRRGWSGECRIRTCEGRAT